MTQTIPPQTGAGARPDSPLDLSPAAWKDSLRRTAKELKADRGPLISAGMAFYWFLAVFPALLAAVGVIGLLDLGPAAVAKVTKAISSALPGDAAGVLTGAVDKAGAQSHGASLVATLIGLALALWSASSGMVALQSGLNVAYDVDEDRKFVRARAIAFGLLLGAAVLGGVATALIVFGKPLGDAVRDHLPFKAAFVPVWTVARFVLGGFALTTLFAVFYYVGPNRESPRWTWVSPGGLVATALWLLASLGFSFYVSSFGSYAKTYGSLAGVVVLLLWMYLSAIAVVVGGELNAELERSGAQSAGQLPAQPSQDGSATAERARLDGWADRMRLLRNGGG